MNKLLKKIILCVCTGAVLLLIPILYSHDTPIQIEVPHLNEQELAAQEKQQQEEQARAMEDMRKHRVYRCKRNDDCIIVDKDPCGCLVGPKGVVAINAMYTLDFNMLQAKTVTKACPERAARPVRECSPSARAVCVKNLCKITY